MKIELKEFDQDDKVFDFGGIRVRAFLKKGKETLMITSNNNRDCILTMPTSHNQIIVQSNKSLL